MKLWQNLECGYNVYYPSQREARRGLREAQAISDAEDGDEMDGATCDGPDPETVPTDKKGLIKWLNENANYTGFSPH